ncbi:MAG: Maf family protein [Maricaulaceae bacterium]
MTLAITLASGSQIRRQILDGAGLTYDVKTSLVDETTIKKSMIEMGAPPRDIADALAEAKAIKVSRDKEGLVIGADQIMVMDNLIYDKPKTMAEARARLLSMRGKPHYLIGAVVICDAGQAVWRHASKTTLHVRDFSENFLDDYLNQEGEDILSTVGAYKFEGRGAQLFSKVEGDFFSILGLSLLPVLDYLRVRGVLEK